MNTVLKSTSVFFVLFVIGSIGVDLVQDQALDAGRFAASAFVGLLAALVFAAFSAARKPGG